MIELDKKRIADAFNLTIKAKIANFVCKLCNRVARGNRK